MNTQGFIILLIPMVALSTIIKGGKWNWQIIKNSKLLNCIFWFGWITALVVGIITIYSD